MLAGWKGLKPDGIGTGIVGIHNYRSATGCAPLPPLYFAYPPYSIHFGYTTLPCPACDGQFHKLSCRGAFFWHGMAAHRRYVGRNAVAIYCLGDLGECSMLGLGGQGAAQCLPSSFSGQCRKSHTYLRPIWHNKNSSSKQIRH